MTLLLSSFRNPNRFFCSAILNAISSLAKNRLCEQLRKILTMWVNELKQGFKGNPNFQDILNWIIQILHYYCRKQHKNIKKLTDYWTKSSFLFSLLPVYCNLCLLFISWTKYFANFKRHKWSFVLYIVLFSGLKMIFSKFSQLDITVYIKNFVYNKFNLHCYFMSSIIERLQIALL